MTPQHSDPHKDQPRTRRAARRSAQPPADPVPPVLPLVLIAVNDVGELTVTVDGDPFEPEPFAPRWRRGDFARLLDRITDQRRTAVRIEVRESDGSVFTDIIAPPRRRATTVEQPEAPVTNAKSATEFVEMRGSGFVPGEDVAVAIVIAHTDASHDGSARTLVDAARLDPDSTGEAILLGRVSGAFTIGRPS